jgi:HAD superfamily hydrolase (TIGR01549 family)
MLCSSGTWQWGYIPVRQEEFGLMALITIDFHNTLFQCDDWFRLEVETLPAAVLARIYPPNACSTARELEETARLAYREIRQQAMQTGVECDAVSATQQVFDGLQLTAGSQEIDDAVRQVMYDTVASASPVEGATRLVATLANANLPLAVVSSAAYHPFLEWCLERYNMRSAFRHVITSASCGIYKSNPAIYQHALDLFDEQAHNAVHIGDSHRFDVSSASQVGMKTILLTPEPVRELTPAPSATIRTLGEATPHLDRLLGSNLFV